MVSIKNLFFAFTAVAATDFRTCMCTFFPLVYDLSKEEKKSIGTRESNPTEKVLDSPALYEQILTIQKVKKTHCQRTAATFTNIAPGCGILTYANSIEAIAIGDGCASEFLSSQPAMTIDLFPVTLYDDLEYKYLDSRTKYHSPSNCIFLISEIRFR